MKLIATQETRISYMFVVFQVMNNSGQSSCVVADLSDKDTICL